MDMAALPHHVFRLNTVAHMNMTSLFVGDANTYPIWKGFRFRCPLKEQLYIARASRSVFPLCRVWCVLHFIFAIAIPLTVYTQHPAISFDAAFFWPHIPPGAIPFITFLVLSIPAAREYTPLIISIAVVLTLAALCWLTHASIPIWMDFLYSAHLNLVCAVSSPEVCVCVCVCALNMLCLV